MKDTKQMSFGMIQSDLIIAKDAISRYKTTKNKNIKNLGAYHVQQAVEKTLKLCIYSSGVVYSNKNLYTHNIEYLIRYAKLLGVKTYIPKTLERNAQTITYWESLGRYHLSMSVRVDTLEKYIELVENWIKYIRRV